MWVKGEPLDGGSDPQRMKGILWVNNIHLKTNLSFKDFHSLTDAK